MSMHTPGPWIAEFGEAYRVRAQGDGGQVAIMTNLKGQFGMLGRRSGDEVAANARLIAAAPELLEALRGMMDAYADLCDDVTPSYQTYERRKARVDAARAAIAKATGEQA